MKGTSLEDLYKTTASVAISEGPLTRFQCALDRQASLLAELDDRVAPVSHSAPPSDPTDDLHQLEAAVLRYENLNDRLQGILGRIYIY